MNVARLSPWGALTLAMLLTACGQSVDQSKAPKGNRPTVVVTSVAQMGALPYEISSNGHVEALQTIEIRPQISAQIAGIHFKEGQDVKAGQLLFTLDARNDEAQAKRSQAVSTQIAAQLSEADRHLARSIELSQANFISPSAVDTARAKAESLRAQLAAAKADQSAMAVKLSYTRILAPFSGRTGAINIRTGGLAQANSATPLVTLTQLDPVQIRFNVAERDLSALIAAQKNQDLTVEATLPDGSQREGTLVFLDNAIDAKSGTLQAKAEFSNADQQLWPGLSTSVRLNLGDKKGLILPLQAIQTGPEQRFVYLIGQDKTAQVQPVQVERIHDGQALVTGIKPGSKVIREGGQNVRPGGQIIEASRPAKAASGASKQ